MTIYYDMRPSFFSPSQRNLRCGRRALRTALARSGGSPARGTASLARQGTRRCPRKQRTPHRPPWLGTRAVSGRKGDGCTVGKY